MLKSELIYLLSKNLATHGDGEIKVELVKDLNENGKVYDIEVVTNAVGFEFEADYITVFEKEENKEAVRWFTNHGGISCYRTHRSFFAWTDERDEDNLYEVIFNIEEVRMHGSDSCVVYPESKVEFIRLS